MRIRPGSCSDSVPLTNRQISDSHSAGVAFLSARVAPQARPAFLRDEMSPLLLLCCGMVIVVGGILWLKLHPFLAMMAAAYTVAMLTPADSLRHFADARAAK